MEPFDLISLFAQKRPSIFKIKPDNTKTIVFVFLLENEMIPRNGRYL